MGWVVESGYRDDEFNNGNGYWDGDMVVVFIEVIVRVCDYERDDGIE